MQDYFILFWWWEDEEYCCKCVQFEMLVRHLSRDIKQTTRSDRIILLLETLPWLPISVRIKSKVFIMAVKVLFYLLLALGSHFLPFFLSLTASGTAVFFLFVETHQVIPASGPLHSLYFLPQKSLPIDLCLSLIPTPFSSLIKFQLFRDSSLASLPRRVSTYNFNSLSLDPD